MRRNMGFTLVEVMVVVAIIAILAAIALPNYSNYVTRSKIPEATSTLSDIRVKLEQYFQDNHKYDGFSDGRCGNQLKYFTITCTINNAQSFTVTATGRSDKAMNGFVFTIDQSNTKTSSVPSTWHTDTNW